MQQRCEEYRDGQVVRSWFEEVPDEPAEPVFDLVALADRVASMNEALDFLILDSLGGL